MRPLAPLLLLTTALLLAGCSAQVDGAKQQVEDARKSLDEARAALQTAQEEARQAKDRFDRVRSMEIVREETVTLTLDAVFEENVLRFSLANATRSDGTSVPLANLTRLPLLQLESPDPGFAVLCDPLTCQVYVEPGAAVLATWKDDEGTQTLLENKAGTLPQLTLRGARVLATTAAGDATA